MKPILLAVAALAAPTLLGAGCGRAARADTAAEDAAIPVRVVPVAPGPVSRPIRAGGVVAAKREWDLSFKVGGVLTRVAVEEGAPVRAGQVLAELDATELGAAVAQAREGDAKAHRDAERAELLAAAGAAPRAAAEDARTAASVAEATLAAAEFNLRHARIVAPEDGWLDRRMAEPGEVIGPGRPVLRVSGARSGVVVRVSLSDRDVLGLAPGAPATVTVDALGGPPLRGRVAQIGRTAARGTGTWVVEVAIEPPPGSPPLLPGLTAKVAIPRAVPAAGAVPLAAVVGGDGEVGAIFTVDGDRARRVPISIAFLDGERAVLAGGVERVGLVVSDGAALLADGTRVRVVP
jgi:multidrug efflux system membrane fusion protein